MHENEWWAQQFEQNRGHLRAVAYRMLGSMSEANDAVQEAWLRLSRSDAAKIENLGGWLTTVVAHVCLDALRAHASRREEALEAHVSEPVANQQRASDPEHEMLIADSVGLALLVVLDRLSPAERIAFVLHDMFDVSFDEIAPIVGRSPAAARQLASRARRRVQGAEPPQADRKRQRHVVESFLTALRSGDVEGLIRVLDPEVVVRVDEAAARHGAAREIRGARAWATGAVAFAHMAQAVQLMLVDGDPGLVWAPGGHASRVVTFKIRSGKIVEAEIIADPSRLSEIELSIFP